MLSNYFKCRKKTESRNQKVAKTRKEWAVCNSKKLKFIKAQEVSGLLSNWGLKILVSKILFKDIKWMK